MQNLFLYTMPNFRYCQSLYILLTVYIEFLWTGSLFFLQVFLGWFDLEIWEWLENVERMNCLMLTVMYFLSISAHYMIILTTFRVIGFICFHIFNYIFCPLFTLNILHQNHYLSDFIVLWHSPELWNCTYIYKWYIKLNKNKYLIFFSMYNTHIFFPKFLGLKMMVEVYTWETN